MAEWMLFRFSYAFEGAGSDALHMPQLTVQVTKAGHESPRSRTSNTRRYR